MTDIIVPSSIPEMSISVAPIDKTNGVYRISWPAMAGITSYKVYVSPTPLTQNLLTVISGAVSCTFTQPLWTPQDVVYYVWVTYMGYGNVETKISDFPAYVGLEDNFSAAKNPFSTTTTEHSLIYCGDDGYMKYIFEEIRRRNQAILENDGEDFYLYLRKWSGRACDCMRMPEYIVDSSDAGMIDNKSELDDAAMGDPDYQSVGRCIKCFGTGIYGGYFPKIKVRIRYGDMPMRDISMVKQGLDFRHDFDSWTLWHPKLHKLDFVERIQNGDRFVIDEVGQSEMRGMPLHQNMKLVNKSRSDIIYSVNDETTQAGVDYGNTYGNADYQNVWY